MAVLGLRCCTDFSLVAASWGYSLVALASLAMEHQSILKEINPEYSLEGLMLKLKLQSFGHLMRRTDSLEKTVHVWELMYTRGGFMSMYAKTNTVL